MRRLALALVLSLVTTPVLAVPAAASEPVRTVTDFDSPVLISGTTPAVGFRATLTTEAGAPLSGKRIGFWQADVVGAPKLLCTGMTGADGVATCEQLVNFPWLAAGFPWLPYDTDELYAQFNGDSTHVYSHDRAPHVRVG